MIKKNNYAYLSKNRKIGLRNQPSSLFFFVLLLFGTILSRLFWLQVLEGSYYRQLSNENRIRLISSQPIRGRLFDRKGKILADNKLTYSLSIRL